MKAGASRALASDWLDGQSNPCTHRSYTWTLKDFARWLRVKTLDQAAHRLIAKGHAAAMQLVRRYAMHLARRKLASSTQWAHCTNLRSLVSYARRLKLLDWRLEIPHFRRQLYRDTAGPGRDVVRKLLAHLHRDRTPTGRRDYAIVRLLYDLGLRRSEPCTLDVEHVDGERLHVAGMGTQGARLPLTMPKLTRQALHRYLKVRDKLGPVGAALFVKNGARMSGDDVYALVRAAGEALGVKVRPHGLRHTAITDALNATGGNVRIVAKFARHSDLSIISRYDDNREDLGGKVAAMVSRRTGR